MLNVLKTLKNLRSGNRFETLENYSMLGIIFGALVFAGGVGLTALSPSGIPAIISMMGALVSFIFTAHLIYVWLLKEFLGHIVKEQPWGVIIITFSGFLAAAIAIFQGLFSLISLPFFLNLFFGAAYIGLGLFLVATYYYFLLMKKWSWIVITILAILSIPLNLVFISFPLNLILLALSSLLLVYLWLRKTLFLKKSGE